MDTPFISSLNQAQLEAATCRSKAVQILAGPGSGKTRVLTSRVAWLVLAENVKPQHIAVVTFTNKAAREMRERLEKPKLLGPATSRKLFMGTFHSLCARLLRQYYAHVNLKPNFTIADVDVSKSVIKKLVKELGNQLSTYARTQMKPDAFWTAISAARNEGMNVDDFIAKYRNEYTKKDICIDFDNLLLYTRVLLQKYPSAANFVRHVLVDEFQDTNSVQYDIVKGLTQGGKSLTIVGDPDQSIFGWRNADRESFIKMQNEYPNTTVCNLEKNYRSTKKILTAALHVVNKDRDRIQKSLFTENAEGVPMSLLQMSSDTMECQSVAEEIKRLVEYSGGLIKYKDIAILTRMSYLSNGFEQALNVLGIPYVVIGGVKFFERVEVKDVLAYLRFFYNRNDTEAFERVINKPKRGVGEVTMNKIENMSRSKNTDIIHVLRDICSGEVKGVTIPGKTKLNLRDFVDLYDSAQAMISNKDYIYKILEHIISEIHYKEYLKKEFQDKDGDSRWDNVGELITYAKRFDPPPNNSVQLSAAAVLAGAEPRSKEEVSQAYKKSNSSLYVPKIFIAKNLSYPSTQTSLKNVTIPMTGMKKEKDVKSGDRIVQFLEVTTLSSNTKEEEEVEQLGKVTISTMHSAKGLEWPCVFSVASESGIVPHGKADTIEESYALLSLCCHVSYLYLCFALLILQSSKYI
ncbi:P-loop containing nucleoside triphosphate hydrolase protein [Zychaea mexicana]|uniref:P-loop containing nucleoside triphosphate hydrolase protein n=1 Tax=Zychaea mexicana TaxID=64656 RepID=UPI0022FF42BE|nr:P-loop containing nucleoside triphosphate hydrolase protein [Zychaea mexicana]KAI9488853.1 P-loop containing nucleoside triphosphate hydrolase protein [Zychaea mexicana]